MIKDESALQTASFWYDLNGIEKYSNAIISYFKKDALLDIRLGESHEVPRVNVTRVSGRDKFSMVIPKLPSFINDEQLQKQIELRKTFLKHELSHICFTPMMELNHFHNGEFSAIRTLTYSEKRDVQFIYNALEDVRIEKLMGQNLEGTNDSFFHAVKDIAVKNDWVYKIVNEDISSLLFGIYVILRAKNVFTDEIIQKISNFRNVSAYEKIYQKYSDFHVVLAQPNMENIIEYLLKISKDLETVKQYFLAQSKKQEVSEDDSVEMPPMPQQDEQPISMDGGEDKQENQNQIQKNDNEYQDRFPSEPSFPENDDDSDSMENIEDTDSANSEDDTESDQMTDEEAEEYDSTADDQFDKDMQSDIENKKLEDDILNNTQKKNGGRNTNNSSLESSLKNEFEDSMRQIQQENKNEMLKDAKDLQKEIENNKVNQAIFEIDSYGNMKESVYDIFNKMISSTFTDEKQADNYSKLFSAVEVPLKEIWRMSTSQQKIKKSAAFYSHFVRKHTKEISLISAYFKNKFKDKKKTTFLSNKEDGFLDDQNLYKALSKKDLDTKIFLQVGKKIGTHANFIFLLDFSGSMSGAKLNVLIKTMIILNEVLNKIGIRFMIYAFSSGNSSFTLPNENMHRLIKSPHLTRVGNTYYLKENLSTENCPMVFLIKKLEEKQAVPLRAFLGNILASKGDFNCLRPLNRMGFSIGHSTKEYQAFIYLTKKYDHMKNKNMIIINDGHYDVFSNDNENSMASYEEKEMISMAINKAYDQIIFDFLYGRPIKVNEMYYHNFVKAINDLFSYRVSMDDLVANQNRALLVECFNDIKNEFKNSFSYFLKKDFVRTKHFDIKLRKNSDYVYIMLDLKKDFLDMFTVKAEDIIYSSYYNNSSVTFKKSDRKVLYNIILENLKPYNKAKLFSISRTSDIRMVSIGSFFGGTTNHCDQLYKNKVEQLRKRGWGIYGIGIQDNSQQNYLGGKFATVIYKTEQLTKEVSKILY